MSQYRTGRATRQGSVPDGESNSTRQRAPTRDQRSRHHRQRSLTTLAQRTDEPHHNPPEIHAATDLRKYGSPASWLTTTNTSMEGISEHSDSRRGDISLMLCFSLAGTAPARRCAGSWVLQMNRCVSMHVHVRGVLPSCTHKVARSTASLSCTCGKRVRKAGKPAGTGQPPHLH